MALETLKEVKEIGGFGVGDVSGELDAARVKIIQANPILLDHTSNVITFQLQNGPIKEVGVNGCQVDTVIEAAAQILIGLDKNFPCEQNKRAIGHLGQAVNALEERRADREKRNVEGTNQE